LLKHKCNFAKVKLCPGCELKLHKTRSKSKQVIGRGSVPADILFLGEAPSKTEDMLGEPFIGPEGSLLEMMLDEAILYSEIKRQLNYYITNTVLCRPWIWNADDELYGINRKPSEDEVLACMPNIIEVARMVKPSLVVFVGKVSEQYYKKEFPESISILHPSFHLKFGGKGSPYYRTDLRILVDTFKEVYK